MRSMVLMPANGARMPPSAVDQQVAPQQRRRAHRPVAHAGQRQRDQRDDDQRIEDDGRQDGALRGGQMHDVERLQLRVEGQEHRRDDGEILGHVVGDAEGGQRAAGHQQLLADLDDLDQLGGVAVQIDHVAGLAGGHGAGVHRHAHIGLGQRRGVVGAVAAHRHQLALRLLAADQRELGFRRGLGEEIVHPGLGGDGGGGQRVVAGDHHRADAHAAQLGEPLADAALDDVLEVHDRRAAAARRRPPAACRPRC